MKTGENIVRSPHIEAMKKAQRAMLAGYAGDQQKAIALYAEAFETEREVAMKYLSSELEPTRSVLFRSAASLAMNCNRFRESKELIKHGLDGNPPSDIMEELLSLHEDVTKKELAELMRQIDEFMKAKTKELNEAMRQARAIVENRQKMHSQLVH